MSWFSNLIGITGATLAFNNGTGTAGNRWKSVFSSGFSAIEARNAADGAYINVRGLDSNIDDDFITQRQFNLAGEGNVREMRFAFTFNSGLTSTDSIPINAYVIDAEIKITTDFDGSATLAVARGATPLMPTSDNNPADTTGSLYNTHQDTLVAAAGQVTVTVGGTPTQGAGVCIVRYVADPLD